MNNKAINNQDGSYSRGREERWMEGIKLVLTLLTKENKLKSIKILDVGCGNGFFFKFLNDIAKKRKIDISRIKYFGLDSNPLFRKDIEGINGKFICCNILNLSKTTGNEKFDIIIASEIIEHIDETDRFVEEIKKVVKRDGYIYLTTPNLAAWHCRLMLLFGFQPLPTEVSNISASFGKGIIGKKYYSAGSIHHIRIFTYIALREFLQYHGFYIIKAIGSGYRKVDRVFFKKKLIGLAPFIIMILKKTRDCSSPFGDKNSSNKIINSIQ